MHTHTMKMENLDNLEIPDLGKMKSMASNDQANSQSKTIFGKMFDGG